MKTRIHKTIALIFSVFFTFGCSPKVPEHYIAFYLEAPERKGAFEAQKFLFLPVVNKEIRVSNDPVFDIGALSDCTVREIFDPTLEQSFEGLFFRIKDEYTIRLKQISANREGQKFILVADGKPLGFCVLKKDFSRGDLFFHVMTTADGIEKREQLEELCFELNKFILEFREYKERR